MKKCRALGIDPADLGISRKSTKQVKFRRKKQSDYAILRKIGLLCRVQRKFYIRIAKMGLPAALQKTICRRLWAFCSPEAC